MNELRRIYDRLNDARRKDGWLKTAARCAGALRPAQLRRRIASPLVWEALAQERLSVRKSLDAHYDRMHGVETAEPLTKDAFDVSSASVAHGNYYMPFLPQPFMETFDRLPIDFENFSFIDFGSGKGRALFLASEYAFRRIIGVELVPRLHRAAQENARKFTSATRRCRTIELHCIDALDFEIPSERMVFYFYNPFDKEFMARVVAKIVRSLQDHPRPVWIVYFYPAYREVFDDAGIFEPFPVPQPILPACAVCVWKSRV